MEYEPPDDQCVLQPADEPNHLSSRDSATALFRSERGYCGELWRNWRRDWTRDGTRFRRSGSRIRRDRQNSQLVDPGYEQEVRRTDRPLRCRIQRILSATGSLCEWEVDDGREHRGPRRSGNG